MNDNARAASCDTHDKAAGRAAAMPRLAAKAADATCAALVATAAIIAAVAASTAAAAPPQDPIPARAAEVHRVLVAHDAGAAAERVVKGAPYCADVLHEAVQWLPDPAGGAPNRIVQRHGSRQCRDGEGRTRQEVERGGRKLVYLRDPVARESWVLDVERKTARPYGSGPLWDSADAAAWRDFGQRMRDWARDLAERTRGRAAAPGSPPTTPLTPPTPAMPPLPLGALDPVMITLNAGKAAESRLHELQVEVMRMDDPALHPAPPPAVLGPARQFAARGPGATTPLPPKDLEGVRVNGERSTWTIEAGKVGNERPIVITREVWTSPELMLTVASHDFDPRHGETHYRLQNVKRGEPDPALMRVPADFATPRRERSSSR